MAWDSPLGGVSELVAACADGIVDARGSIEIRRLVVSSPVELQSWLDPSGAVAIGIAPPRQALATSVMPVLHRIRITMEVDR